MAAALVCKIGIHSDLDIERCCLFYGSDEILLGETLEELGIENGARVEVMDHGDTNIKALVDTVHALHCATTMDSIGAALGQAAELGYAALESMMDAVASRGRALQIREAVAALEAAQAQGLSECRHALAMASIFVDHTFGDLLVSVTTRQARLEAMEPLRTAIKGTDIAECEAALAQVAAAMQMPDPLACCGDLEEALADLTPALEGHFSILRQFTRVGMQDLVTPAVLSKLKEFGVRGGQDLADLTADNLTAAGIAPVISVNRLYAALQKQSTGNDRDEQEKDTPESAMASDLVRVASDIGAPVDVVTALTAWKIPAKDAETVGRRLQAEGIDCLEDLAAFWGETVEDGGDFRGYLCDTLGVKMFHARKIVKGLEGLKVEVDM